MNLDLGNLPRTIWVEKSEGGPVVGFVDQRLLPDDLALVRTADWREVVDAVKTLAVRGAPAIGVAGAAAVMLAAFECAADESAANLVRQGDPAAGGGFGREGARAEFARRLEEAARVITGARPTAVNLSWGVRRAVEAAQEARSAGKTAAEAAEALYARTGLPREGLEIFISKRIPMQAGLGGGSADAAAVLRALNRAYDAPLSIPALCELGAQVGSDVPFCVMGGTALGDG